MFSKTWLKQRSFEIKQENQFQICDTQAISMAL